MDTRSRISATVRALMFTRGMSYKSLAGRMGLSETYLPRKISENRWTVDELDLLAKVFSMEPEDFVRGYEMRVTLEKITKTEKGEA